MVAGELLAATDTARTAAARWVLAFDLAGQVYAVPVGDVVEVVRMVAVTPVPESPPWLAGVVDYRGRVIPVVDGRARFGLPRRAPELDTPIVVVAAGGQPVGLVVDQAREVLELPERDLAPAGAGLTGAPGGAGLVTAVARPGRPLVLLLDTARLAAGAASAAGSGGEVRVGAG
jgi:purine-binding chemotaxis protein CheW